MINYYFFFFFILIIIVVVFIIIFKNPISTQQVQLCLRVPQTCTRTPRGLRVCTEYSVSSSGIPIPGRHNPSSEDYNILPTDRLPHASRACVGKGTSGAESLLVTEQQRPPSNPSALPWPASEGAHKSKRGEPRAPTALLQRHQQGNMNTIRTLDENRIGPPFSASSSVVRPGTPRQAGRSDGVITRLAEG
ncbi:hypothetical protein H106_07805 [Trichophyton rubrum CBS 735.88]|uniref:Uncharacterized protein n=1 Tax=Trichophyton rubrum (strain ATCC MYA-4607 / CBS 118892) TaxID=559305 RepID=A0A080WJP1_TRIRC|nr:uncharacterized protein TERG_12182 [Trichophyton rubrum CBS 118892]EZG01727.1 hypothetical protein H106_07805 [Trichophyton rubrum CBS 735.88]KFL61724.1 hypothetical protein TERG_12182 [Trichophyton rubrum CBS 118892]